jgi:hypothetical protein
VTTVLLRGRVLSFRTRPESLDDRASYLFEEDGGVLIRDGKVAALILQRSRKMQPTRESSTIVRT